MYVYTSFNTFQQAELVLVGLSNLTLALKVWNHDISYTIFSIWTFIVFEIVFNPGTPDF